jgi:FKBP-type peptidyl-prolyl cis-trans isomerase FkpA
MKKLILAVCILSVGTVYAQDKTKTKTPTTKTKSTATETKIKSSGTSNSDGFATLPSGLEYKITTDVPGTNMPKVGDYVEVEITTTIDDSVIFDTKKMNNNQPVQFQVQQSAFKGDIVEGIQLMTPGDVGEFRLSIDSLQKAGSQMAPWMKPGTNQKLVYHMKLISVKSQDQVKKEQEIKAGAQKGIDDKILQDYFAKNNIKATKTESGLYYKIDKMGTGPKANTGDTVVVNYTGKTLDGKTFDSNVDPQFQHTQPFTFMVGMHQVITGWDEGFMIFKKGSKGTLYIPSNLAYGDRSPDPARIPNNGILMFDIEMLDVKPKK